MALDFDTMAPTQGSGLARRTGTKSAGPNPFLDKGWLLESYNTGKDYQFGPVAGEYADYTVKGGKSAGQVRKQATGDLADVISLIRAASNKLGIGAVVQVVEAQNDKGRTIKGQWYVLYLGKQRKAPRRAKAGDDTANA
jgi:hypothetical protein